jgi:hypothetical protein
MHKSLSALPVLLISFAGLGVAACGSTSTGTSSPAGTGSPSTPTAAPTATPTAAAVNVTTCPTASTVNSALGFTVAAPTQAAARDLPTGDTGITCTYFDFAAKQVVIVDFGSGPVATPFISLVEAGEKKAAAATGATFATTSVSGVGSQAVIVTVSKAGTPTEDGILAVSGNSGLVLTVEPSASQSQLESFASQLLG